MNLNGTVTLIFNSRDAAKRFADSFQSLSIPPESVTEEMWREHHVAMFQPLVRMEVNRPDFVPAPHSLITEVPMPNAH